jgi:hypothetical protein
VPSYETTSFIRRNSVDKFDDTGRSAVAPPVTDLGNARVAARAILHARANVVEKVLNQILAVDEASGLEDLGLLQWRLAYEKLFRLLGRAAVADEHAARSASAFESVFHLRQRDQLLNQSLQLLRSAQSRVDIAVSNELPLKVVQEGASLVAGKAKFASIYEVSH